MWVEVKKVMGLAKEIYIVELSWGGVGSSIGGGMENEMIGTC